MSGVPPLPVGGHPRPLPDPDPILVVGSDLTFSRLAETALTAAGYAVACARSAAEALTLAAAGRPSPSCATPP